MGGTLSIPRGLRLSGGFDLPLRAFICSDAPLHRASKQGEHLLMNQRIADPD
jgi:hypothetical protein